jgi:hypothetical protein
MGIKNPSPDLIANYIRAEEADEESTVKETEPVPAPEPIIATENGEQQPIAARSSKSRLLPRLRESWELIRQPGVATPAGTASLPVGSRRLPRQSPMEPPSKLP